MKPKIFTQSEMIKYFGKANAGGSYLTMIDLPYTMYYDRQPVKRMRCHVKVAQELQTTKGSGNLNMDMSNVNKGAVMMALPIAKSIAIKDACDHFGDLFGANLNRKDIVQFTGDTELLSSEAIHTSKEKERVIKHIENANTLYTLIEVISVLLFKYLSFITLPIYIFPNQRSLCHCRGRNYKILRCLY